LKGDSVLEKRNTVSKITLLTFCVQTYKTMMALCFGKLFSPAFIESQGGIAYEGHGLYA
jgi:hypothetical protein